MHAEHSSRAQEVVADLDLATKVRLLSGRGFWALEALPEHGIDGIIVTDGPHGLRCQSNASDHLGVAPALPATCFPTAAALGSSWDVELLHEVGEALALEAIEQGVSVVLGPGLNLKRHPAGGRSFEYLSEDPLLSGRLAAALVRGVQSHEVGTSAKHYAVNNQESHRLVVDAIVDERTLRELYLSSFEIVVTEAEPWTVMCAYNKVNGTYASEHTELLTTILRDEWGFDGLVMTDWGAANDRVAGIAAGLDLEMPSSHGAYDAEVVAAVRDGRLDESAVDRCARRVVELLLRARRDGDRAAVDRATVDRAAVDEAAHHDLARRAAAAGSVLLRNESELLPLSRSADVAVIGEFAQQPRYQGAGSSQVNPRRLDRAIDRICELSSGSVTYCAGYDAASGETTPELLDEAVASALDAEVVVLFAGLPSRDESEGFDRAHLDLPEGHLRLIEAVAATPTPVVVVLNNGGVVHLPWADRVEALLECWLGGQAGGSASADVLYGELTPGGRLAESVPHHVTQLPADRNFPGEPRQVQYRETHHVGYRFHDTAGVPARFPFGHGLGYTSFEWSDVSLEGEGTDVVVRATVTNTGPRPGSDVVQVYVRDVACSVPRPDKELKGFAKVHLEPGASQTVEIALDRRSFAVWDVATHSWMVDPGDFEVVVARSSTDPVSTFTHDVASDDELTPVPATASWVADRDEFTALLGRPIPPADPVRPFTRNSTLEDLSTHPVGRLIGAQVVREGLKRSAEEFPDPDEATLEMVRSSLNEGPARMLVLMSDGLVRFDQLDLAIAALNGRWSALPGGTLDVVRSLLDRSGRRRG